MASRQDKRKINVSLVLSAFALIVALTGTGAVAARTFITSKQIKNGTIRSADIRTAAVRSSDLGAGAVQSGDVATGAIESSDLADGQVSSADIGTGQIQSSDIGNGEVTVEDITAPEPLQIEAAAGAFPSVHASLAYKQIAVVGSYTKADATTQLEVSWTGSASAGFSPCVFQLRVDGQPSAASAGEVYVANSSTPTISATALFPGLPTGAHSIEVWVRATLDGSGTPEGGYPCTVAPAHATIGQTFVVAEQLA